MLTFPIAHTPTGAIWQSLGIIEWLHLAHSPQKLLTSFHDFIAQLVIKRGTGVLQMVGSEPNVIVVPFSISQNDQLFQTLKNSCC